MVKDYVTIHSYLIWKCAGSCNTLDDLSNRLCVPDKTEDLNPNFFNMITGINESSGIMINVNLNVKTIQHGKKTIVGILLHVAVRMVRI